MQTNREAAFAFCDASQPRLSKGRFNMPKVRLPQVVLLLAVALAAGCKKNTPSTDHQAATPASPPQPPSDQTSQQSATPAAVPAAPSSPGQPAPAAAAPAASAPASAPPDLSQQAANTPQPA